jgi:hypothetical protein
MKQLGLKDLKKKWHKSVLAEIKRLKLPEPDHEYGFSTGLLVKNLSSGEFHKFEEWMEGQTCMLDAKLGVINYTHDVIRGLDFIRHGTPTFFD